MLPTKHLLVFTLFLLLLLAAMCAATGCRATRQAAEEESAAMRQHTDSAATLQRECVSQFLSADSLSQLAALTMDSLRLSFVCPPARTAAGSSETAPGPCGSPLSGGYASARSSSNGKPSSLTVYGLHLSREVKKQSTLQAFRADSTAQGVQSATSLERSSVHKVQSSTKEAKPFSWLKLAIANISFLAAAIWLFIRLRRKN